ncbi:MAG TPA: methyltransferase domain-containing protein [Desulfobacterales bacterium]|nr:methyltransferase domain-containing protein [Desulfobacterales bacterium]
MIADHQKSVEFYQENASKYDEVRFQGRAGEWNNLVQMNIMSKLSSRWRDKQIIEVGCGSGRCTKMLLDLGCKLTAAEPSEKMIALAQRRCELEIQRGDVEFIMSDIESLACLDKKYDVVIAINVFSRLPEGEQALAKLVSLLSEQGEIVFNFQCITSILFPFGILVNKRKRSLSTPVYSRWYTPAQIRSMLSSHGATVKNWFGHHYVPVPKRLFLLWPGLWIAQLLLNRWFPKACPSVFVVCTK